MLLLIQPRHTYAPPIQSGETGHIYLPTSLISAASRLTAAGIHAEILDENLSAAHSFPAFVGINIIGPPYLPVARRLVERGSEYNPQAIFFLGGQGLNGINDSQFGRLFGSRSINGNHSDRLARALGIDPISIPSPESTPLVGGLKLMSERNLRLYLSNEFSIYLSQGCRFSCTFCAADRSVDRRAPARERYRSMQAIRADLDFLFEAAARFRIPKLNIYLSNLDLFQSPIELRGFETVLTSVRSKWSEVGVNMRALSTAASFCSVARSSPDLISSLRRAGLQRLGFGVDGATSAVWFKTKKPLPNEELALQAIKRCWNDFGIRPETLMVFGHNGADNESSLDQAVTFMQEMSDNFGAIPRPHVAKDVVPGNDGWVDPTRSRTVEFLLSNPAAFQLLDFTTVPTWLTHPDPEFRQIARIAYQRACSIGSTMTLYTLPEDPTLPDDQLESNRIFNRGRYDL